MGALASGEADPGFRCRSIRATLATCRNLNQCYAHSRHTMPKAFAALLKQPYWVIALILGAALVAGPCITIDKNFSWNTHPPTTYLLVSVGLGLLLLSIIAFGYSLLSEHRSNKDDVRSGVDLARVKESKGVLWTRVSGCEICVVTGRIEAYLGAPGFAVVLPRNEYFDDRCVDDTKCIRRLREPSIRRPSGGLRLANERRMQKEAWSGN